MLNYKSKCEIKTNRNQYSLFIGGTLGGNNMETNDLEKKVTFVLDEFKDDDLFNHINEQFGAKDLLSTEDLFFQELNFQQGYSTNQAARLLERELTYAKSKTQALVNYLQRPDFHRYLGQAKRNGRYRYDWRLLFKLRMIFYLVNHGLRPSDISEILGEFVTIDVYNDEDQTDVMQPERIGKMKQEILDELFDEVESKMNEQMKMMFSLNEKRLAQIEQKGVSMELGTLDLRKNILEKQINTLNQNKLLLENIGTQSPKGGFFSKLFNKPNEQDNQQLLEGIQRISSDIEEVQKELGTVEQQYNRLIEQHPNLTHKKQDLITETE